MKFCLVIIASALVFTSCQKVKDPTNPASVLIIQANPDLNSLVPVFGNYRPQYFSNSVSIGYGSSQLYSPPAGEESVIFYFAEDTLKPCYSAWFTCDPAGIYSLFLAGNGTKLDTVLIREKISNYADGSAGVRIINLSPDSPLLSINFDSSPGQAEFSNLSYKQYSAFRNYPQSPDGYYNFEIHDQNTGDLLTTYSWTYQPGKNNTIVISGSVDPSSLTPLTVFQVNHY